MSAQNQSRKRCYPSSEPEAYGDMTRIKRPHLPASFPSLTPEDRKAIERVESIMQISLSQLLAAPGVANLSQKDIENDVTGSSSQEPDEEQATENDKHDSSLDRDTALSWDSSAAEFDNIDNDIVKEFENIDPWARDFGPLSLVATQLPATGVATSAAFSSSSLPMIHGHQIQQNLWSVTQAGIERVHPVMGNSFDHPSTDGATSDSINDPIFTGQQPWEIVENFSSSWPLQSLQPLNHGRFDDGSSVGHNASVGEGKSNGALRFVPEHPLQPQTVSRVQRRGPFQDRDRQEETGRTRGLKACVRCRMQKIRCSIDEDNPTGVCLTCMAVSKQKVHTLPCLRHRLTECTLYRTGKGPGLEFTFRWRTMMLKDITEWESLNTRTVMIKSDVCEIPLKLVVRRFVPIPEDSVHRSWVDHRTGKRKFKKTTPYAIVNMKNAVQDMREYIATNVFKCMGYFLRGSDQLVKETYEFARRYMQRVESDDERKLLGSFFRLWFAIRRTATTEHIVGDDTLDMEPETKDESCPLLGKVPLPPVMIQQLDMVLTLGILEPLRKQVLEEYQKLALTVNSKNWMTIYLVTFMSLHSCAKISEENYNNARKHGLKRRYAIPNFIEERHHSANVFLSHYHYRTESSNPFKQDWKQRHMTPFSHMSVDDIQFLERTKVLLSERDDVIKTNRKELLYEHELYFISQMFEENWQPRDTIIDRTEGTVNDVGLKRYVRDDQGVKR